MTPAPSSETLKKEKINSPFRLVAATLAFKILNKFTSGTTQKKIQERYDVKPKQLALYLTGRRYLGGSDRKRRLSGQEEGAGNIRRRQKRSKKNRSTTYHPTKLSNVLHHLADKSQPGEWWVAAGRGADYPVRLAKMPTTHLISSCKNTASHLTIIMFYVIVFLLQNHPKSTRLHVN